MITLSSVLWERTLGLCGSLSGNPYDDFRSVSGERLGGLSEFVESWSAGQCQASVSPPCQPGSQTELRAAQFCQKMLERDGLHTCYANINPIPYYQSCKWTFCQESQNIKFAKDFACDSVDSYVRACREEGLRPSTWRTPDFCRKYYIESLPLRVDV